LSRERDVPSTHAAFINRVLARIELGGQLFRARVGAGPLPVASADHGAAGIAYAALRLACRRGDAQLLALADLWITKVLAEATTEDEYYNDALDITRESVSAISFHHMAVGVHFVRALVSHAMADGQGEQRAIDSFVEGAQRDAENLDLTLGRASVLHGCTLLLDQGRASRHVDATKLLQLGDTQMDAIWRRVDTFAPVGSSGELTYLGMAHGWAGLLYSALRWYELKASLTGSEVRSLVPATITDRLRELASCGRPAGRGLVWSWFNTPPQAGVGAPAFMPGWCNGNAGHVFLWTLAHRVLGDETHLELARRAAWGMLEQPTAFHNLCCGATGCAYATLNLYRHTGDRAWLMFTRRYADRVATVPDAPPQHSTDVDSLYKGEIGMMVLLDDLADPDRARMPLLE
jgi:serine/threonine-protein kinase